MQVEFLNLKSQVNRLTNIIVVYGEDDYLRDRAVEQIKASLDVEFAELNCDSLRGATMDEVISSAVILPFGFPLGLKWQVKIPAFLPPKISDVKLSPTIIACSFENPSMCEKQYLKNSMDGLSAPTR